MRAIRGVLLMLLCSCAVAQEASAPIRVDVRLVNVFVNVEDANGAVVGTLAKEDFVLTEDGRPQRIAVFDRQSEMPLSIVLAMDTSGSVRKDLALEQRAARRFVHALLRPVDQLSLIEFSSSVREVVPFTNRLGQIDNGLDRLRTGPATALYDAVYLSSQRLSQRQGRKVLVLISDGSDTVKGVDYARALEEALQGEVMVYSLIDVPIEASAGRELGGEHAMISLSEQTGGKYYYVEAAGLDKAFEQVANDLRTQYLLAYYPARHVADSNFHRIEVKLRGAGKENYQLRHRTGYYAASTE